MTQEQIKQELYIRDKEIYDLNNLLTFAKVLNSSLNLEWILDSLIFRCFGQFTCSRAAIYLYASEYDHFKLEAHKGYEEIPIKERLECDDILFNYFQDNQFLAVSYHTLKNALQSAHPEAISELELLEPVALSPFTARDAVYGYIFLSERITGEPFNEDEVQFLSSLSNLSGLAVYNARLHEMAILDQLTRLARPHYFHSRLKEEILEANKFKKPLCLIMMDIDDFKQINDTYGHLTGDKILQTCGQIIRYNSRNDDIAARYGGDEIGIILPNTTLENGLAVVNRLKKLITEHAYTTTADENITLTCSFGIANYEYKYPMEKDDFIEQVDQLLYHAKRAGKDRIAWKNMSESAEDSEDSRPTHQCDFYA